MPRVGDSLSPPSTNPWRGFLQDRQCTNCADVNDFCAEECGGVVEHRPSHDAALGSLGLGGVGGQRRDRDPAARSCGGVAGRAEQQSWLCESCSVRSGT